jgi:DNA-binding MarR family transcriptional regulator/N-acetylglutamate synthase-like GNAT family acetyltransferase
MNVTPSPPIEPIRAASRRLVRELGFLRGTLAGTEFPPSTVHALVEIGARETITAGELSDILGLEKSSVSRMLRKLVAEGIVEAGSDAQDGRAKPLSLTPQGRAALDAIDRFARKQVADAMGRIESWQHRTVIDGLQLYADALAAVRAGTTQDRASTEISTGYRPGAFARCIEMHALYYARTAGFGRAFEARIAEGLAEFSGRLDRPCNQIWLATQGDRVVGTIAIDGEDLGAGRAHLRWFIVDDAIRGGGIGRRLLAEAVAFCDRQRFPEIHLWTFQGLDAARRLYQSQGFSLAEERPGRQWGEEVMEQRFTRTIA